MLPRARPGGKVGLLLAAAASVVVHAAVLSLLLPRAGRSLPPPDKPLEVELVQQPAEQKGAPPPPPVPSPESAPAASAAAPSPPAPPVPEAPAPTARAAAPSKPNPATPRPPPAVNLGEGMRDSDPLTVTGDNVVPPAPDARFRNLPPRYPPGAARAGIEGTVQLQIRVAPNGLPLAVEIASSSGNAELDAEARRAVQRWHFNPARVGGHAVPYDYVLNINFTRDPE